MIKFTCDQCGYELELKGIVNNHYAFMEGPSKRIGARKFEQLIPQLCTDEVTDVCDKCFDKITKKRDEVSLQKTEGIFSSVRSFIQGGLK